MRQYLYILLVSVICITSCKTSQGQRLVDSSQNDMWGRIQEYDLSQTVINPEKIPSDDVISWWSEERIKDWQEQGNELEDVWFDRMPALGYRGEQYHKFDIHFSSVTKQSSQRYEVKGLVRCQGEVSRFLGSIVLDSLSVNQEIDDYSFLKQPFFSGRIFAHYEFDVFDKDKKMATMSGKSTYDFLEIDGSIWYDSIMLVADGYFNNQYEGVWVDIAGNSVMKCNWGDYRIPDSEDLDIGAGEFAPAQEYRSNGWRLMRDDPEEYYEHDIFWWQAFEG